MKISLIPALFLVLALGLTGCGSSSKKGTGTGASGEGGGDGDMTLELNADSDSNKAGGLKSVYFDFDSSQLSSSARSTLDGNAAFLKGNEKVEVQVEGHCDERGGVQYNLALGENRAKAVKEYLVALGVGAKRVTTISFGKERPVSFGHSDDAWSKNRRGNFVVTAK